MAPAPHKILVLNGPNLNLLGEREPAVYGESSLADVETELAEWARQAGAEVEMRQSNHEGDLIDWLHEARGEFGGVVLNPGGLTHSSVSLADAVAAVEIPVVEVHLSNIYAREAFRAHSYVSRVATGVISGLGTLGYRLAAEALLVRAAAKKEG